MKTKPIKVWTIKVSYSVRTKRQAEILKKAFAETYYDLARKWCGIKLPKNGKAK